GCRGGGTKARGGELERARRTGRGGGGRAARHKLPGIRQVKKPVRLDGLLCVCGNCKNVGLISAAPSGNRHRRMAVSPYPACMHLSGSTTTHG
ncbi:hypothetical protein D0Z98_01030, partial [Salmonella enterica subsp. enterica serovar Newport]|nr:hypothetical protein [Salmonella enterica subsp. enterica serovar Newport]